MARTVEETIKRAIIGAFAGSGKVHETIPEKSYMAIATSVPNVGEHYHCKRIEKKSNREIYIRGAETTTVQKVQKLAGNVYVAITRNSCYVTKILGKPEENVQFAIIKRVPLVGYIMECDKLEWNSKDFKVIPWNTTDVQAVKLVKGLYHVKTRNTTYICLPMI